MGKRSNFTRVERDYYPTPIKAVEPLIDHLPYEGFTYVEPCAGDGRLVNHISELTQGSGKCVWKSDIEPRAEGIRCFDVMSLMFKPTVHKKPIDFCITNPPWERSLLHYIIGSFSLHMMMPTWLLFDADWMHTKQSAEYMAYCKKVVSVGRVKWIEGSKSVGKDNCCWYLFDYNHTGPTEFYGRLL